MPTSPTHCRSKHIFAAALLLALATIAFRVALPAFRQHTAIREFTRLGGSVSARIPFGFLGRFVGCQMRILGPNRIPDCGKIHSLNLSGARITDQDLAHLDGQTDLEWLAINRTSLTDTGMRHLEGLTGLRALRVEQTQITDVGRESLRELKNLEVVSLRRTSVTNAGLAYLRGLRKLRHLDVDETHITAEAVAEFRDSMPGFSCR